MRRLGWTVVVALAGATCVPAGAQNFLINPDFVVTTLGWNVSQGSGTLALDAPFGWPVGVGTPGSLSVTNTSLLPSGLVTVRSSCMDVPDVTLGVGEVFPYVAAAYVYERPQGTTGKATVGYEGYSDNACASLAWSAEKAFANIPLGSWHKLLLPDTGVSGTRGMRMYLKLSKNEFGGSLSVRFDGLYLGRRVKGDFNTDGHTDLVLDNLSTNGHALWTMGEDHRLGELAITPDAASAEWRLAGTDNFLGDGRTDLVFQNSVSGAVEFWEMAGTTRVGNPVPLSGAAPLPPQWSLTATADFDHDLRPDLVWQDTTTSQIVIWSMDGTVVTGALAPTPDAAADANWSIVAALDFDYDGNTDLLWYNATTGKLVMWFMDANVVRLTGGFTTPDGAGDANWKVVAAGDFGLGLGGVLNSNDIVWRNTTSGKLVVWHMYKDQRTAGGFFTLDSSSPVLGWTVAGPR